MTAESTQNTTALAAEVRAEIDRWLAKYPPERKASAVLAALSCVQEHHGGSLTPDLMDSVAAYLEMPNIAVYEVASFYSMFDLKPVGRHKISVCTNISCLLRGGESVQRYIEAKLGIQAGQTTPDGRITLKVEEECLAACCGAPMLVVDGHYHENLTPAKVDQILAELE